MYRNDALAALEVAGALRGENEELRDSIALLRATLLARERGGLDPSTRAPRLPLPCSRRSVDAASIVTAVLAVLVHLAVAPELTECTFRTTKTSALELRRAAETWRAMHDEPACPTPERLRDDKQIDTASKLTDAWDRPFRIHCTPDETYASSAGPDGRMGTDDDIIVPGIPPAL
jgi:hypothetical protein